MIQWNELTINPVGFSLGSFLGTSGTKEVYDQINAAAATMQGDFFGTARDPLKEGHTRFIQTVVEPIRIINEQMQQSQLAVERQDGIIPITSVNDILQGVPPMMRVPILTFRPIRALLETGRIDGWGVDPATLPDKDPYRRPLLNGHLDLDSDKLPVEDGMIMMHFTSATDDPELTDEEVEAIRETREFLQEFLEDPDTAFFDPTDYPRLKG